MLPELRDARVGWLRGVDGVPLWYLDMPDREARATAPPLFAGARHEILMESDPIRSAVLDEIASFLGLAP